MISSSSSRPKSPRSGRRVVKAPVDEHAVESRISGEQPMNMRPGVLATILILVLMVCGPLVSASAENLNDGAALKGHFEALSQHGNVECSVQFEKLIGTMGPEGRLQGSCCAPMDETRYRQQIEGLKKYSDIAEVPP